MNPFIRVTAQDLATGESGSVEILDDYCLITAGRCEQTYVQVSQAKDGSETHIITVKGVRRGVGA